MRGSWKLSQKALRARFLSVLLFVVTALSWGAVSAPPATAADCGTTYTQGTLSLEPSHGKVLYIDSGVTPRIDAAYIGYRITNTSGSAFNGWVSLSNFTGGVVGLANPKDAYQQLPEIPANGTKTVYFLVKASISTKVAQTHTVSVFTTRPDASGASASLSCEYSFTKVAETIKAAANKVQSVTVSGDGTPELGEQITVTAYGNTGTIGAGSSDVGPILWFSPNSFSTFPTAAVRLESVRLVIAENDNWNSGSKIRIYSERLLVKPATVPTSGETYSTGTIQSGADSDFQGKKRYYKNEYKFRIVGKTAAAAPIKPIAQISSGTQIKHTDIASTGSATINSNSTAISLTVTKSVPSIASTPTATIGGVEYLEVGYRVTVDNTGSGTIKIDEVVDSPANGVLYKSNSTTVTGATWSGNPIQLTGDPNPKPWHFVGPFSIATNVNLVINYTMYVPKNSNTTYSNTAFAYVGSLSVGSGAATVSSVAVVVSGGTITSANASDISLAPVVITDPASDIGTTTATLNGTVDPNGATPTVHFHWSTSSTLATYDTITVASPATGNALVAQNGNFTGGTSGTTYYYRIIAIVGSTTYSGEIVSFTLYEPAGTPTVTTTAATSITATTAVLNGVIDPNLRAVTAIRFRYSTTSASVSGGSAAATTLTSETDAGTENATLSGANPTDISLAISGLVNNTTYYFRAEITYTDGAGASQTLNGDVLNFKAFTPGSTSQTISFDSISEQNLGTGTYQASASASSGLPVTYTSEVTAICTVSSSGLITFVTTGTCIITVTQPGNGTYAAAEPVSRQFDVVNKATVTYFANSATSGSVPTSSTHDVGTLVTVAANSGNLTRTNFTFVGWDTSTAGTGTTYAAGSGTFTINANTNLYAKWNATITYHANGAAGSPPAAQTSVPGNVSLASNIATLSYTGFTFIGWNTLASGLGDAYDLGGTYNLQGNVTLYATWQDNSSLRITYNGMGYTGGTLPSPVQIAQNSETNTATTNITKPNLAFSGWSTASNYPNLIVAGETVAVTTSNINLYAVWRASVSYNPNNGAGTDPSSSNVNENASFTPVANPYTRDGYTFAGWNTAANGSGDARTPGVAFTVTRDTTLYAQWTINSYTLTFNLNNGNISGGTTNPTETVNYNVDGLLSKPTNPTRSGFTFLGWGSAQNSTSALATYAMPAANSELFALWSSDPTYSVTYDDNVSGTTISVPTDGNAYLNGATVTVSVTEPTRSGYTFGGWTLNSGNTGTVYRTGAGNTNTYTMGSANITFYAIWTAVSGGTSGGGGGAAPAVTPTPKISSLSKSDTCSIATEIIIYGSNLEQATVTLDGATITASSVTASAIVVTLPAGSVGKKTLRVTTANGSDSITIEYLSNTKPAFQAIAIPYLAQDLYMSLPISATNATSYSLVGTLPTGISLNTTTGELSGTPRTNGIFSFSITANGKCGSTTQDIEIDIDKPTPNAISHRILFPPGSCELSPSAKASLDRFLEEAKLLAPRNLIPEIYLSGLAGDSGAKADLEKCRQDAICDLLLLEEMLGAVLTDVFEGSPNRIEIIIYWPRPVDAYV